MKKSTSLLLLAGCLFLALNAWGQVQRQDRIRADRSYDETKQEIALLKAEVERLTKVIKVTGSLVKIEAGSIQLQGNSINLNYDGSGSVRVYSPSYFYAPVYGRNSHFVVW